MTDEYDLWVGHRLAAVPTPTVAAQNGKRVLIVYGRLVPRREHTAEEIRKLDGVASLALPYD